MSVAEYWRAAAIAVALGFAAVGCGPSSRVTSAKAAKIVVGMSEDEVAAMLGPRTESAQIVVPGENEKLRVSIWSEGDRSIEVTFIDGKVSEVKTSGL